MTAHRVATIMPPSEPEAVAGFWRRLMAMVYDMLLVVALLMTVTAVALTATRGEALYPAPWWYLALLTGSWGGFFVWFWVRAGQTLGMRAWHLRILRADGTPLRTRDAVLRLAAAGVSLLCLGLGFLWMLVDRERLSWHDRLSATRIVRSRRPQAATEGPGIAG